ncbi:MAG: TetR/AcrR family transcriptional regulator [bacterium]
MKIKSRETREKILDAAKHLFQKRSYDSVSMDMVAHKAGVSKGCLYIYFKSKSDLFTSIFEENINHFEELIEKVVTLKASVADKLRVLLERMELSFGDKRIIPFFPASKDFSPEVHKAIGRRILPRIQRIKKKIAEIFREGIREGEIKEYAEDELALIFLGMIFAFLQEKQCISNMKSDFLELLFHGIKKETRGES